MFPAADKPQTSLESIGPTVVTNVGNKEEHLQLGTNHHTQKVLRFAIFVVTSLAIFAIYSIDICSTCYIQGKSMKIIQANLNSQGQKLHPILIDHVVGNTCLDLYLYSNDNRKF